METVIRNRQQKQFFLGNYSYLSKEDVDRHNTQRADSFLGAWLLVGNPREG